MTEANDAGAHAHAPTQPDEEDRRRKKRWLLILLLALLIVLLTAGALGASLLRGGPDSQPADSTQHGTADGGRSGNGWSGAPRIEAGGLGDTGPGGQRPNDHPVPGPNDPDTPHSDDEQDITPPPGPRPPSGGGEGGGNPGTPGGTTPQNTPKPTPVPTSTPAPAPAFGGESPSDPGRLAPAVQTLGYSQLMHVRGEFDLTGAVWSISDLHLPAGLTINPSSGTIHGTTEAELGVYVFQVRVAGPAGALTGWFSIEVVPWTEGSAGETEDNPGDPNGGGDGANPDPSTGGGDGDPDDPETTPSDPPGDDGSGGAPGDPGDGGDSGSGNDEDGGTPGGGVDDGDGDGGDDSGTDNGDSGSGPTPGSGDEDADPTDPNIDPGSGGSQYDVLTLSAPDELVLEVGESIDYPAAATSKLGRDITYSADGLPGWMAYADGRLLATAPMVTGSFNVALTAATEQDAVTKQVTVKVKPLPIVLENTDLELTPSVPGTLDLRAWDGADNASFVYTVTNDGGGDATITDGVLTVTFAAPGEYRVYVHVEDIASPVTHTTSAVIDVVVTPGALTLEAGEHHVTQYLLYTATLTPSGGWGGYTYRVIDGALPAGLTLTGVGATATLGGATGVTGTHTATVQVTDRKGLTAQSVVTIIVDGNPAITPVATITAPASPYDVAFSPDNSVVYVVSYIGKTVTVMDAATHTPVGTITLPAAPRTVAPSPDGRYIAVGQGQASGRNVWVYDAATYELVTTLTYTGEIFDVEWAADSSELYTLRKNGSRLWFDVVASDTWAAIAGFQVTTNGTSEYMLQRIPDGRLIASNTSAAFVIDPFAQSASKVYDNVSGRRAVYPGDGKLWVVSGGTSGGVMYTYDLETGIREETTALTGEIGAPSSVSLSPDGRWLYWVSTTQDSLYVVDTHEMSVIARVPVEQSGTNAGVAVSADGTTVYVTSGLTGTVVTVLSVNAG